MDLSEIEAVERRDCTSICLLEVTRVCRDFKSALLLYALVNYFQKEGNY